MTEQGNCPQCARPLPSDTPQGLCPACLLKRGLESNTIGASAGGGHAHWTPPTAAELAASFPDLDIIALIGRGGMGAVYKARQKKLDRLVALKILPPEIGRDAGFARRFADEAQAMARLSHPNIVTIHDFGSRATPKRSETELGGVANTPNQTAVGGGTENLLYFFVMEYVDGLSLRQLLDRGTAGGEHSRTVSPTEALAIVPQICDALQYAHDRGIVHRDIKPENILLNRSGQVKIADFGLAKLVGSGIAVPAMRGTGILPVEEETKHGRDAHVTHGQDAHATEKVMGTPQYMAPEQIDRPGAVDHRADIYSLGVVFYQMLTGELPRGKFEPPSRKVLIDVRLDEVVLRALEKQPHRRYQQVSEIRTQVETIVATSPPPVSPKGNRPDAHIGLKWEGRKRSHYVPLVGVRNGRRVIHWSGVVGAGLIVAALTGAGAIIFDLILYRLAGVSVMGYGMIAVVVLGTIIVLGSAIRGGLKTPLDRLVSLDSSPITPAPAASPRMSRLAVVGAVWAPLAFIFLLSFTARATAVSAGQYHGPEWWQILLLVLIGGLGITAPFGTTICGAVAISRIRHSAGRLYGLGLALFDTLVFPLLALDGLIGIGVVSLWSIFEEHSFGSLGDAMSAVVYGVFYQTLITAVISIIADFLIVLWAWRAVKRPVGSSAALSKPPGATAALSGSRAASAIGMIVAAKIVHWTARILGTLWVLLLSVFVLAEGTPPVPKQPAGVQIEFAAMALWVVGCLVGWWRAGWAAVLILLGSLVFHVVEWRVPLGWALEAPTIIGLLYFCSWWLARGARKALPPPVAGPVPDSPQVAKARQTVKAPAIGLIVAAGINIAVLSALLAVIFLRAGASAHVGITAIAFLPFMVILAGPLLGCLILLGALRMMQVRNRGLAIAGALIALIAAPGNIIGLPMGIWALIVLGRREVIEAFVATRNVGRRGRKLLVVGLIVILAMAVSIGVYLHEQGLKNICTLEGRVTDAVTGKPIAGARVADNIYGAAAAKAPSEAWTDASGRFSLRTWREEHTLAVSAPGYRVKLANFEGRRDSAQMDFALQPVVPPWREALIPDADTKGAATILDLASGKMLVPSDGRGNEQFTYFTRLGQGDIGFDRVIFILRGGKLVTSDGKALEPKEVKADATAYDLAKLPEEVLVQTAGGAAFRLKVINVTREGGLRIRYVPASIAATRPAKATIAPTDFLPLNTVVERTVYDDGVGKDFIIDFDTGKLYTPTEEDKKAKIKPQDLWNRGFDAGAETAVRGPGLYCGDMIVIPLANERWENVSLDGIRDDIAMGKPGTPVVMSALGPLPRSYIFKTREGSIGALQILELVNDIPRHIKIRYKLLEYGSVAPAQPASSPVMSDQMKAVIQVAEQFVKALMADDKQAAERITAPAPGPEPTAADVRKNVDRIWANAPAIRELYKDHMELLDRPVAGGFANGMAVVVYRHPKDIKQSFNVALQRGVRNGNPVWKVLDADVGPTHKFELLNRVQVGDTMYVTGGGFIATIQTASQSAAQPASTLSSRPAITRDQVIVEDLALEMLVAIREKDDAALKALAVDRTKGWRDALPHFSMELRERFQQMTGKPFTMYPAESIVRGNVAAVKCIGPKELNNGAYLALFFVKTGAGWKNFRSAIRRCPGH